MPNATIGTTATLFVEANPERLSLVIYNLGPSVIFYGQSNSVTTANSPGLASGASFTEDNGGTKVYCGPFYVISSGATSDVRYWERTR